MIKRIVFDVSLHDKGNSMGGRVPKHMADRVQVLLPVCNICSQEALRCLRDGKTGLNHR
jgi:hypothetical protein